MNQVLELAKESQNVAWLNYGYSAGFPRAETSYCADGDGIVTVELIDGFYNLFDQGTHIKKLGRDLSLALKQAEHYMHRCYRQIYDDHRM
jgi:hypothetical protein